MRYNFSIAGSAYTWNTATSDVLVHKVVQCSGSRDREAGPPGKKILFTECKSANPVSRQFQVHKAARSIDPTDCIVRISTEKRLGNKTFRRQRSPVYMDCCRCHTCILEE